MLVTYFSLNCLHSFTRNGKLESHKNNENIVLLLKTPNKKKTNKMKNMIKYNQLLVQILSD